MPFPCGICNLETTGSKCLLCRTCDTWLHADCDNVSKALFSTLDKNRNLAYTCTRCMENPPDNSDIAFKAEMRKEFANIKESLRVHTNEMKKENDEIKAKFESFVREIRAELYKSIDELRNDVANCKNLVISNDISNKAKFMELEMFNHALQHRQNRSDIIITGLSDKLSNLNDVVVFLCAHLKVDITPPDIHKVMYIKNGHAVLVQFRDIYKRDKLMSAYFKHKSLKVSDVLGGNNESRVYLNDNYSTLANKLQRVCWKYKNENKIKGYSLINRETLKIKVVMINNEIKILSYQECIDLFKTNSTHT